MLDLLKDEGPLAILVALIESQMITLVMIRCMVLQLWMAILSINELNRAAMIRLITILLHLKSLETESIGS